LLILITVLCIWLGIKVNDARRQRQAITAILNAGGTFFYDYQSRIGPSGNADDIRSFDPNAPSPGPGWLRKLVGDDYFSNVVAVDLYERTISESDFKKLPNLRAIVNLDLIKTKLETENGTRALDNRDLALLCGLTELRVLSIRDAKIDGDGLSHLSKLKHLWYLDLGQTRVDDQAMLHIGKMTNLGSLMLDETSVTDIGLSNLAHHAQLEEWLSLADTRVTDDGLTHLQKMQRLKFLLLQGTEVTQKGVRKLKRFMPNTGISMGSSNKR
jgi:hypothetical protein